MMGYEPLRFHYGAEHMPSASAITDFVSAALSGRIRWANAIQG